MPKERKEEGSDEERSEPQARVLNAVMAEPNRLETYLRHYHDRGDTVLQAEVRMDGNKTILSLHPTDQDGDTVEYIINGNFAVEHRKHSIRSKDWLGV